jgi:hypothetical protein
MENIEQLQLPKNGDHTGTEMAGKYVSLLLRYYGA